MKEPIQELNGRRVQVITTTKGNKFAVIDNNAHHAYPLDLCAMAAGKDAWLRDVLFTCECGEKIKAEEMEGHYLCQACYEKLGEELD